MFTLNWKAIVDYFHQGSRLIPATAATATQHCSVNHSACRARGHLYSTDEHLRRWLGNSDKRSDAASLHQTIRGRTE